MRYLLILVMLLLPMGKIMAQTDDELWQECIERWAEETESETPDDETLEQLSLLRETPFNLNDTNSTTLGELPFINPIQVVMLKAYIRQYGPIMSWTELGLIRGFDSTTIRLLRPITTLDIPKRNEKITLGDMLKYGKNNIVWGGKRTIEPITGYQDGSYVGSPYRMYFRYQFKYHDNIIFQLSGDKDAGEEFFGCTQKMGFDFYGYLLQVKNIGRLRNAIVGKYNLQFGQGLTMWSGFAPWNVDGTSIWRNGQGIRNSSAFCEYGFLRGAAASLNLGPGLSLTGFFSYTTRDATLTDSGFAIQSLYNSGYHRSENELSKKHQVGELLYGANLQYQHGNLSTGMTAYHMSFEKPIHPANYIYNSYAFAGESNTCMGAYYSLRTGNIIWFGEASLSNGNYKDKGAANPLFPFAVLTGFQYPINSNNKVSGYYRHYSPSYQNIFSRPIGQTSTGQNEEGVCVNLQTILPFHAVAFLSADIYRFPWMRYRIYEPSEGAEYRARLEKNIGKDTRLTVTFRTKNGERNTTGTDYHIEETCRRLLSLQLDYHPSEEWQLATRITQTWFSQGDAPWSHGYLAYQDVTFNPSKPKSQMSISFRYTIFNVEDYDARIYTYEDDLVYEFSTPSFLGQGYRFYAFARCHLSDKMTIGLKYDITQYVDRESIGSGHDKINRSHKQEIKLQLRLTF